MQFNHKEKLKQVDTRILQGEKKNCDSCDGKYPIEFPICPKCYLETKDDIKELHQRITQEEQNLEKQKRNLDKLKHEYVEKIRGKYKVMYRVNEKYCSSSYNEHYYFDRPPHDTSKTVNMISTSNLDYDILSTPGKNHVTEF